MGLEVYRSVEAVPEEIDSVVILGKQLGIGSSLDDVRRSPDRLSVASRINVIGGSYAMDTRSAITDFR